MVNLKTVNQCISFDYYRGWNDAVKAIGRCGECKHFINMECTNESLSTDHEGGASYSLNFDEYDYCSYFESKGV